jgi:hypothetical protein
MDENRAALLSRCEDAYRGVRDAKGLNDIISAIERAEDALGLSSVCCLSSSSAATAVASFAVSRAAPSALM